MAAHKLQHRASVAALLVAVAGWGLAGVVYGQAVAHEDRNTQYDLDLEARRAHEKLDAQLRERILALARLARQWELEGSPKQAVWSEEARLVVEHDRGFQAIEWADPSAHIRWIVPLLGNEAALGLDLLPAGDDPRSVRRRTTMLQARATRRPVASRTLELAQGGRGFSVQVAIDGGRQGTIVGVFRMDHTVRAILGEDFSSQFAIAIYDGDELAFGQVPDAALARWRQSLSLDVFGVPWQLLITPRAAALSDMRSAWPEVLGAGLALIVCLIAVALFLALTAREHARRVVDLSEARARFLALMSHEIRTPLNGLLGTLDMLRDLPMDTSQSQLVDVMQASGARLLVVVNDVLDLSKLEAKQTELTRRPFAPRDLAREAVRMFAASAEAKGLTLHAEVDADVPDTWVGDGNRLAQVLFNLMGNAVKFTTTGEVRLTAKLASAESLVFEVSDTGPGIAEDALATLFQPFVQAGRDGSRRQGGTGLGLFICKEWMQLMGGSITVSSPAAGGTRFTVTCPMQEGQAAVAMPPAAQADTAPRLSAARPRRVLIAEDNAVNRMITQHVVQRLGYEATLVNDGQAAIVALGEGGFDAILMDCHMPVLDGFEATRRLRSQGLTVPIVALTASALHEDQVACKAAGMDAHVTKPIDRDTLARVLDGLLRR